MKSRTPLPSLVGQSVPNTGNRDATNVVVTDVVPTITITNRTTGEVTEVAPTLMQDVNIGVLDRHYGNNVTITPDSDLQVRVTLGDEQVSVDGHLD